MYSVYKDKKIRIAVVGCGRISKNHLLAIAQHADRAKISALCDIDESKLFQAKKLYLDECKSDQEDIKNIKKYRDFQEMLIAFKRKEVEIDLVVLATPSGMHAKQTIASAQLGLNICTEKPMATKWEDGLEMVEVCKKLNVKLFVVKQNRFNKTLQLLKKQIDEGRFGKLALITVNVFWQRPQSYYDQDEWRGTWEQDGGALMNQASHYVDMISWLIGPVNSLSASIATISRSIEVEDTAVIEFQWDNGALGTMAVTMLTYPKNLEGSITILGENGSVRIGGKAVNKIEHWEFKSKSEIDKECEAASYETTSIYGFGHPLYYKNLLDALFGEDAAMCSGEEGLKSLELLEGAYRSARSKKKIFFPLQKNG